MRDNSARYWLGKKRPAESIAKMRAANVGRKATDETKLKLSLSHIGIPSKQKKAVLMFDKEGVFICEYASLHEAGKANNIGHTAICGHLKKGSGLCAGNIFKYKGGTL